MFAEHKRVFFGQETKANQLQKQCTQRSKECSFKNFNVFGGSQQKGRKNAKGVFKKQQKSV